MPVVVPLMHPKSYNHAFQSAGKPPATFKPQLASTCGSPSDSPNSPSIGSMNYSTRHSHKPSLLLNSRNITIRRLLLNASPPQVSSGPLPPRRGKPLALSIPSHLSPTVLVHEAAHTPVREFLMLLPVVSDSSRSFESTGSIYEANPSSGLLDDSRPVSNLRSPLNMDLYGLKTAQNVLSRNLADLRISEDGNHSNVQNNAFFYQARSGGIESLSSLEGAHRSQLPQEVPSNVTPKSVSMPEELQEVGLTHAYPQGPANVLNSVLYLYSAPEASVPPINVNDYDLVINVARECDDLSAEFDLQKGNRKYLRVPWTHTSTILKELPMLTREIAAMDKPGRKILVHCQCGVLRSACVVVAYFMVKFKISVNEAYELLKSGTENKAEACSLQIREAGNYVEACERICPNMSLIFELMDFGERLATSVEC